MDVTCQWGHPGSKDEDIEITFHYGEYIVNNNTIRITMNSDRARLLAKQLLEEAERNDWYEEQFQAMPEEYK